MLPCLEGWLCVEELQMDAKLPRQMTVLGAVCEGPRSTFACMDEHWRAFEEKKVQNNVMYALRDLPKSLPPLHCAHDLSLHHYVRACTAPHSFPLFRAP